MQNFGGGGGGGEVTKGTGDRAAKESMGKGRGLAPIKRSGDY